MLAVLVVEEIEDAVLLHETRNEVEVRFAVLNTVLQGGCKTRSSVIFVIRHVSFVENLFNDVGPTSLLWKMRQSA